MENSENGNSIIANISSVDNDYKPKPIQPYRLKRESKKPVLAGVTILIASVLNIIYIFSFSNHDMFDLFSYMIGILLIIALGVLIIAIAKIRYTAIAIIVGVLCFAKLITFIQYIVPYFGYFSGFNTRMFLLDTANNIGAFMLIFALVALMIQLFSGSTKLKRTPIVFIITLILEVIHLIISIVFFSPFYFMYLYFLYDISTVLLIVGLLMFSYAVKHNTECISRGETIEKNKTKPIPDFVGNSNIGNANNVPISTAINPYYSNEDPRDRLKKLEQLKEENLINDQEYQEQRKKILSEL